MVVKDGMNKLGRRVPLDYVMQWMRPPFCTPALSALYVWSLSLEPKGHSHKPHAVDICSRVDSPSLDRNDLETTSKRHKTSKRHQNDLKTISGLQVVFRSFSGRPGRFQIVSGRFKVASRSFCGRLSRLQVISNRFQVELWALNAEDAEHRSRAFVSNCGHRRIH